MWQVIVMIVIAAVAGYAMGKAIKLSNELSDLKSYVNSDEYKSQMKGPKGDMGDQGPKGDPGTKGDKGFRGNPGASGESAYQIAVRNGFVGTEQDWLDSLKGKDGVVTEEGTITSDKIVELLSQRKEINLKDTVIVCDKFFQQ